MNPRIKEIYKNLKDRRLDGFLVSFPSNITYLSRYLSRDSYLLVSEKQNLYFTDSRYIEVAKKSLKKTASIIKADDSVFKLIANACLKLKLKRIGFEERYLPFAEYSKIKEELKKGKSKTACLKSEAKLIPTHNIAEELRQTKDPKELKNIRKAIKITEKAFKFAEKIIKPGKREIEIVAEIERFIRYEGASNSSFDIIVACGPNSSFPHHVSSNRKIADNDIVLIDMGVEYSGYKSDLTRVFFLGKIKSQVKVIYSIVLAALNKAITNIKPGVSINKIDKFARQHISQKGYGGFFGHNLGHGIGLDTHEEPHISGKNSNILEPNMVFTIEPAIYLPNKFGVRIEDMVLVTQEGSEVLSDSIHK